MDKRLRFTFASILLIFCLSIPTPIIAENISGRILQSATLTTSNTVIVSNKFDALFSQDFSVLLKHLRLKWIVLDSAAVPDSIQDKNLILLGHPVSEFAGTVIRGMLSEEEIENIQLATDQHLIFKKESPWLDDRTIYICTGADFLQRRNAAEELIHTLIADAPPASNWIRTTYDLDAGERNDVAKFQYQLDTPELPLQDLAIDVDAKPRRVTSEQAADDVGRLFYLLSHGYSGYAFFNQNGEFELAKSNLLQELPSQTSWSSDAFADLLHKHLGFIVDCHMSIGDNRYAEHSDFWYDTKFELTLEEEGYKFGADKKLYTVISVNNADPRPFLFPSLNQQGNPIYRLGQLSTTEPLPLLLMGRDEDQEERQFEIMLQRSDFDHYSADVFREETIGGVPVVRARSFSDIYSDELNQFIETASNHRGDPVVIVDLRGNGGGNEHWPSSWIQELTGIRPASVFVFSELESKTSMMGRANAFAYWDHNVSDPSLFRAEQDRHRGIAENFESGTRQPQWAGPLYPQIPLIPNDTTVVVITNDLVASAGEGFVLRISQAENVVVVGENSMGALTFGNISVHQLPNSKLMVWLPINFNFFTDLVIREELGLAPDLWVPAADTVSYVVAAIRQGTITTYLPLPQEVLEAKFVPESPLRKLFNMGINFWIVVGVFAIGSVIWAYFMRKKPRIVLAVGLIWPMVSWYVIKLRSDKPFGYGLLGAGIICFVWGGINTLNGRKKLQPRITE
jgi:hypothetical protein